MQYEIPHALKIRPVTVRIGKSESTFESAKLLMERLDNIGKARESITAIVEDGKPWDARHVAILRHYLLLCQGIDYYSRAAARHGLPRVTTRWGWLGLRSSIGIPDMLPDEL